jgi:SAM-dependent methyltransferase
MAKIFYNNHFYARHQNDSLQSANKVVPLVWNFVQPRSVVDVGCGVGTWLSTFITAGAIDVLGIDGDYVDRSKLLIEPGQFTACNLEQPLDVNRRFDLAVSLEVAEHLPSSCADTFVESLTRLAPVILFSAAVPHQGGTNHINEQWPEYWQTRFRKRGYVVVDCLRPLVWRNPDIATWYKQNLLFYVDHARLQDYPALASAVERSGNDPPLSFVHPELYFARITTVGRVLREVVRHLKRLL